jgi:hypothetical protein
MANGAVMDEQTEQVDEGQDYREPIAAPQQVAQVRAPVVTAPGGMAVAPPAGYRSPFLSDEEAQQQTQMRKLQYAVQDLPLAEAEKAVSTAMKFQAIRGYQRELANGTPAHEALAKWAPMMFAQPKAATLGQAASMVRATTPQDKYMDIGGVGYQMKGGVATPLTPPKAVKAKTIPLVLPADPENPMAGGHVTIQLPEDDPLVKKALERARTGAPPTPAPKTAWQNIKEAFGGGSTPAQPVPPPGPAPSSAPAPVAAPPSPIRVAQGKRIRVRSKQGKFGSVPAEQLDAALAAGYVRAD